MFNVSGSRPQSNRLLILMSIIVIASVTAFMTISGCKPKSGFDQTNEKATSTSVAETKPTLTINQLMIDDPINADSYWAGDSVIIFYSYKAGNGKIMIDGVNYSLNKNEVDERDDSRILTGPEVVIKTSELVFDDEAGGDCNYGKFDKVSITFRGKEYTVNDLRIQQCPEVFSN